MSYSQNSWYRLKGHERYMGGCQNCGPLLGPLDTRCGIILRTQNWDHNSTTTHIRTLFWAAPILGNARPIHIAKQPVAMSELRSMLQVKSEDMERQ